MATAMPTATATVIKNALGGASRLRQRRCPACPAICGHIMSSYSRRWLLLALLLGSMQLAWQVCYVMKLLSQRTWDTPEYKLHLLLHEQNNTLSSVTYVRKDVPIPLWHIVLMQHQRVRNNAPRSQVPRTLYNSTYRTCEFWKYMRRMRVFNNVAQLLLGASNMSLACPLKVGNYVMNVITVPPDTGILKFMYFPNTLYTMVGTVYSLNPRDGVTKVKLCGYEINATIYKTC